MADGAAPHRQNGSSMAAPSKDLYAILGVPRSATTEQIKAAFRKLAMQYHPDRNAEPDAAEKFKEIGAAYEILSDAEKRAQYDQFGIAEAGGFGAGAGFEGFDFGGFGDIFDAFFGGRRSRRGPVRGQDLRVPLELTFDEAAFGAEKEIRVSRNETCSICGGDGAEPGSTHEPCPDCGGAGEVRRAQRSVFGQFVNVTICARCEGDGRIIPHPCHHCGGVGREQRNRRLRVKVPAGVDTGSHMRLTGEGDAGLWGGPAGNLYVDLLVRSHPVFERDGDDLVAVLPLSVAQAALGTTVEVPVLRGDPEALEIPPGTQHGQVFHLRGKGVPHLHGRGTGDLVVKTEVRVPTKLTAEQRELFQRLDEALGASHRDGHNGGGLFSRIRDAFTA